MPASQCWRCARLRAQGRLMGGTSAGCRQPPVIAGRGCRRGQPGQHGLAPRRFMRACLPACLPCLPSCLPPYMRVGPNSVPSPSGPVTACIGASKRALAPRMLESARWANSSDERWVTAVANLHLSGV
eukprot:UN4854